MSSSVMDSEVYRGIFVSERMRKVFSDESLMQKWLDAWVALARAEADLGVIPQEAAKKIADKASFEVFDPTLIREGSPVLTSISTVSLSVRFSIEIPFKEESAYKRKGLFLLSYRF